ncbi:hypothetical protein JW886_09580 [Lactococcus taiwanensis]|uniref:Uncharacterized protein n=1 Tax=Lactococcus taiwanensis TaxID=1151742 RepID=A0AA45KI53_9LACT|nr:hypothetical protein [Lactococcus taiwanensis]QSE76686.1 hypothetical protein JW886_09580 [Lactococcus taiwanensis]
MIYEVNIKSNFDRLQQGVNTRTADIEIAIINAQTKKLFKCFSISPEIIRDTETDYYFEIDFRRCYIGREEGRILSKLGVQKFSKNEIYSKDLEIELNYE